MMASLAATSAESLADFIRKHHPDILPRWLAAVRDCAPAMRPAHPVLFDHLPEVLDGIADAIDQTVRGARSGGPPEAAVTRAMGGVADRFELRDVLFELILLRHVLLEFVLGSRAARDPVKEGQLVCRAVDFSLQEVVAVSTLAKQRARAAVDRVLSETLATQTLGEWLPRLLATLVESTPKADVACILLIEGDRLVHRAAAGVDAVDHQHISVAMGEGIAGKAAGQGRPMSVASPDADESSEGTFLRARGIRTVAAAPLVENGNVLGVLQIGSRTVDPFSEEESTVLPAIAERIAAAVREQQLRTDADRLAGERAQLAQQLQMALDAAGMGWWSFDPAAKVFELDRRAARILGIEGRARAGLDEVLALLHPGDRRKAVECLRRALDPNGPGIFTGQYRLRSDGASRWIEDFGRGNFEGEGAMRHGVSVVGALSDITERKQAEEALRRANEQLREADRLRTEFLSVLSHELRNPLAPIKNSIYILERAIPGGDQARRAQVVIARQVDQLARLVDDLLDVTRLAREKIRLQRHPLELNQLVRLTADDYRPMFDNAGVQLEVECAPAPVLVCADWNRLAQVFGNLLQNAVKFTARGGRVSMTVSSDGAANRAVVRVVDSGEGMSPETLARLFEPFAQADRTLDRSKGGLGLGLALVKGVVELHGGEVTARSEGLGRGSEFTIRLPIDERQGREAQSGNTPTARRRLRVLIIEDNADAADSLGEVLELEQQEVVIASNGPEGIAKARKFRPDVVLCDIGLPGMDGYEVARVFRGDESLKGIYLVALSGYALPEDLGRAADAGFDRHLAKPPRMDQLESVIASAPAL